MTKILIAGHELDALIAERFNLPCSGQYSIDMNDAWLVVEKFRRGWNGKVAAYIELHISDRPIDEDCICIIYGPNVGLVDASAKEMPLAICLAALKAVEG